MKKKFNNKTSDHIILYYNSPSTGIKVKQDYFISRSVAVVGVVFAITPEGMYVLVQKRSEKMRDEAGKIGLPCGYLDFDETIYEAMIREVYEETSLYIPDYEKYIIFNNNKQPFKIKDDPKTDKHQNISHIYVTVFDFESSIEAIKAFPNDIEIYKDKEVEKSKSKPKEKGYFFYIYKINKKCLLISCCNDEKVNNSYTVEFFDYSDIIFHDLNILRNFIEIIESL